MNNDKVKLLRTIQARIGKGETDKAIADLLIGSTVTPTDLIGLIRGLNTLRNRRLADDLAVWG